MSSPENPKINPAELPPSTDWVFKVESFTGSSSFEPIETGIGEFLQGKGWGGDDIYRIQLLFHEWMLNAILHGSLFLNKEDLKVKLQSELGEKFSDDILGQQWDELIKATVQKTADQRKKVFVGLSMPDENTAQVKIQDQGKATQAFWENGVKPKLDDNISRQQLNTFGMGWAITEKMLGQAGHINFQKNDQGTEVTLTIKKEANEP